MSLGKNEKIVVKISLLGVMVAGVWLRLQYIQAQFFHVDEFISMLAIKMILEQGQPIFPSGLYYDHGLLYSYLGAVFSALFGGDLFAPRWWSLIIGVAAIPLSYFLCVRLFELPRVALFAAVGMAFLPEAVAWGGRVRM